MKTLLAYVGIYLIYQIIAVLVVFILTHKHNTPPDPVGLMILTALPPIGLTIITGLLMPA